MKGIVELTLETGEGVAIRAKAISSVIEAREGSHGTQVRYASGSTPRLAEVKEDYDAVMRFWKAALSKRPRPSALE
jgi:hypothetical protein